MNTKSLAIATAVGTVAVVALLFAYPAMAASVATFQDPAIGQLAQQSQDRTATRLQLSVGQTFTLTSVAGGYRQVGDRAVNGTASGSMTFRVDGAFSAGYALSVTGGTISINGTTYTISGGSAELGRYGVYMTGQGQTSGSAHFLLEGKNLGKFGSTGYGVLKLDLSNGVQEFGVRLLAATSA